MAILHKNITVSSDIHNPKWLPDANNGDYAFKNEKGELESIDELLLPAALNFVDGSVAPPTTTTGDIYILSSGGSVNAGWGSVSLQDWVRYDGTAWNSLTPQKSSLCYDKTADSLMSFDGSAWAAIGGGGGTDVNAVHVNVASEISGITAKATPTTNDIILIEDAADSNNKKKITIGDLPASTADTIYTADGTLSGDRTVDTDGNKLTIDGSGVGSNQKIFVINKPSGEALSIDEDGDFLVSGSIRNSSFFGVEANQNGYWYHGTIRSVIIGKTNTTTRTQFNQNGTLFFNNSNSEIHRVGLAGGGSGQYLTFFKTGFGTGQRFLLGGTALISTEDISLQGNTVIQGGDTLVTSSALRIYDGDTTPSVLWAFRNNGDIVQGKDATIDTNGNILTIDGDTVLNANVNMPNLPTSASGLSSGDIYNDSGTLKIV